MKFRRNVGLYRGSLDAAPLATVFFLLVILEFLLLILEFNCTLTQPPKHSNVVRDLK